MRPFLAISWKDIAILKFNLKYALELYTEAL